MKWFRAAAVILLLATPSSCIGPSRRGPSRPVPVRPAPQPPSITPAALNQCLADLNAAGVKYTPLPDRDFGGGCQAFASVKLLDIGVPAANLGAMRCPLARAFAAWVYYAVLPAARLYLKQEVVRIDTFGTYACRGVNGAASGALSEHAYANAVDVAAFVLADGRRVSVKSDWNGDEDARAFLKAVHDSACKRFATVLSPDYNQAHADHLHFDMGRGPFCR